MVNKLKKILKSQIAQFIFAAILITVFVVAYIRIDDVIKLIGLPFKILPNMLGISDSVSKSEVMHLEITANTNVVVAITEPGYYFIYTSFFYDWSLGPKIEIKTPGGVEIEVADWRNISRFFDTIYARGAPSHRFYIEEPGPYRLYFIPRSGTMFAGSFVPFQLLSSGSESTSSQTIFKISLAPDYVTQYESTYRIFYWVQASILLILCITIYYQKVAKAALSKRKIQKAKRLAKRKEFDNFVP